MAAWSFNPYAAIVMIVIALVMLRVLTRLFSSPQARRVGGILLLPLMFVGALVLAFVVLGAVSRFSAVQRSEVTAFPKWAPVEAENLAAAVDTSSKPGSIAPARARHPGAGAGQSGIVRVIRAVYTAFFEAARSAMVHDASAASGALKPKTPGKPTAQAPKTDAKLAGPEAPVAASGTPAPATSASKKRPGWIDHPPQPSAERYEVAVTAGPWTTRAECEKSLMEEIEMAIDDYAAFRLGEEARWRVRLPEDVVRNQLVAEQYLERIDTKFGEPMFNLHALLRFDAPIDAKLRDAWSQRLVTNRLVGSAVVLGGALLLLTVIYAYLRISLAGARVRSQKAG